MDNKVYVSVDTSTANNPSPFEKGFAGFKMKYEVADIMVRCAICEEHVSMSSDDYRAQGVFICDKCKAAIKHIRDYLENGGSAV
jgi:hypothetical protein